MQVDALFIQLATGSTAVLFALSVLHKLLAWQRFKDALAGYGVLPAAVTRFAAPLVVLLEAAVAVSICASSTRSWGAWLGATLLLVYAIAIAVNLARGRTRIDCGCLGRQHRQRISAPLLLRNGLLAAIALCAALPSNQRPLEAIDWLTLISGVSMLALLYAIAEQLLATRDGSDTDRHGASA